MIRSFAKGSDAHGAYELLGNMKKDKLRADVIAWTAVLSAFLSRQHSDRRQMAESIFREMVESRMMPNRVTVNTLTQIVGPEQCAALCQQLRVNVSAAAGNHRLSR